MAISPALRAACAATGEEIPKRQGKGGGKRAWRRAVVLETLVVLELHQLRRAGSLVPGRWFTPHIPESDDDWYADDDDEAPQPSVTFYTDAAGSPFVLLITSKHIMHRWPVRFRHRLTGFGSARYFECPSPDCRCVVRKFYVDPRRAIIGCRHCLRGVHASTKMLPWQRAGWMAAKIRARLGADDPDDDEAPFPPRRPYAWGKNYDRLRRKHDRLMSVYDHGLIPFMQADLARMAKVLEKVRAS
jgi:hypothetical protein